MSAAPPSSGLPGITALRQVCHAFGADPADARLLHARSNAVYLLPREQLVARLAPPTPLQQERARTVIAVTRWLADQPEPVALAPSPGDHPVVTEHAVATFWPYRPTSTSASLKDVGELLRRLHLLPEPPFAVPRYRPLHRLREALTIDGARREMSLSHEDLAWLADRAAMLTEQFASIDSPLGTGLVHADAHTENAVAEAAGWRLIDWDQACIAPRELDLVSGLPDHFHTPDEDRRALLNAYGFDLTTWPQWTVLRDITELHSLSAYIRLAPSNPEMASELRRRVRSLRTGDRAVQWRAVS